MKIERAQSAATLAFICAAVAIPALMGAQMITGHRLGSRMGAFLLSAAPDVLGIMLLLRLRELLSGSAAPRFLDTAKVASRLTGLVWTYVVLLVLKLRTLGGDSFGASSMDVLENLGTIASGLYSFMLGSDLIRGAATPLRRLRAFAILQFPMGVGGAVLGFVALLPDNPSGMSGTLDGLAGAIFALAFLILGGIVVASNVYLGLVFLDAVQYFRDGKASSPTLDQ